MDLAALERLKKFPQTYNGKVLSPRLVSDQIRLLTLELLALE